MEKGILTRIRRAIRDGRYDFTDHLLDEAAADGLTTDDILDVLWTGTLDSTYSDDLRGIRYVIRGDVDTAEVDVVCRFTRDGSLLIIITTYVVEE